MAIHFISTMINVKKVLRMTFLVIMIILALSGIGIIGQFNNREKYMDNEIKIEQVDKRDEEEEDEGKEVKG